MTARHILYIAVKEDGKATKKHTKIVEKVEVKFKKGDKAKPSLVEKEAEEGEESDDEDDEDDDDDDDEVRIRYA